MKNILTILLCLIAILGWAKEDKNKRINYCTTLEEAMQLSAQKHKPIFFNCYAGWSGGSIMMDSIVLREPELVKFIEKNFISLRMDMVKTQKGRAIAKKYNVRFYAHFLILDEKGQILHRIVGGSKAQEFQKRLEEGLNPKTSLAGLGERYEKGKRTPAFLEKYANALDIANEKAKYTEVTDNYLQQTDTCQLLKPSSWKILSKRGWEYNSKWFHFIYNHRNELIQSNGEAVLEFIVGSAFQKVYPCMIMQVPYNKSQMKDIEGKISALPASYTPGKQLLAICDVLRLRQEKNYSEMLTAWEKAMTNFPQEQVVWKFDISLANLQDMNEQEKKNAAEYLKSKIKDLQGSRLEQYQHAIECLNKYQGIIFETGSLQDALDKARKENKPVFVDCFTSWCGPCHMMSTQVFPSKEAGDFFNSRFVNIKIDMEKGEGKELLKRWKIAAFPTYLILNNDGEPVYTSQGYIPASELIKRMQEGLDSLKK